MEFPYDGIFEKGMPNNSQWQDFLQKNELRHLEILKENSKFFKELKNSIQNYSSDLGSWVFDKLTESEEKFWEVFTNEEVEELFEFGLKVANWKETTLRLFILQINYNIYCYKAIDALEMLNAMEDGYPLVPNNAYLNNAEEYVHKGLSEIELGIPSDRYFAYIFHKALWEITILKADEDSETQNYLYDIFKNIRKIEKHTYKKAYKNSLNQILKRFS